MAQRVKLPKVSMSDPATLKKALIKAMNEDSTPKALAALMHFASSYGGFTDIKPDLFKWLQEKIKTG